MRAISGILAAIVCFTSAPARPPSPPTPRAVLDLALRVAERLEGAGDREGALEEIAIASARVDPSRSVALAERLASQSTSHSDGPLPQIALALLPVDVDRALEVLFLVEYSPDAAILETFQRSWSQYPTAARRLFDAAMPLYQDDLRYGPRPEQHWLELSAEVVKTDPTLGGRIFEWALGRAQRAVNPEIRSDLLRTAVKALLQRDRERALALARQISDPDHRGEALLLTAAALRRDSLDRSRALYREGVDCLQEMSEPARRDSWLERAVLMWAEVDPIEAEALARRVTEPRERNFVLYLACREMWRQDVDRALRLAHSLPPDAAVGNRDEALAALAAGVAQSDPERALGIAADIHSEFNHGEFSREVALQAIITAMAHRNLSRALSLLPRVRDTERKVFFLLELAREKGGHAARHRQWLSLAAATARRLPDPADRVEWLTRIVTDAAPEPGIARPLLRQAYALALQRVNANGRDQALTAVAGAAVEREPDWAMRVAGHLHSEAARAGAVHLLSGPLARHDPARALRSALRCPLLPDRCGALVAIAEALAPAPGH